MPCEIVSWLQAKNAVKETTDEILQKHTTAILQCLGGIRGCLEFVLKTQFNVNTSQALNLNKCLVEINKKEKADKINANKENEKNDKISKNKNKQEVVIVTFDVRNIGTKCIEHITTFLTIQEIAQSFKNVCTKFAIIGIEQTRKADYFYMNGHDLIIKNQNQCNKDKYINKIGFNGFSWLTQYRIFKDNTFKTLFAKLSTITDIPLQHLAIWNYTERKNKNCRPNREIKLNWNEKKSLDVDAATPEMILTHTVSTFACKKLARSIHARVGNILMKKRMFILLDERKINSVPNVADNKILIGLKYFDIFSQTQYFVDWIYLNLEVATMGDITNYIENNLIGKNKYYFTKCEQHLQQFTKYERNNRKQAHFKMYDEEEKPKRITQLDSNDIRILFSGDILIFQLNPNHPYFAKHPIIVETVLDQTHRSVYQNADSFMLSLQVPTT